MQFYEYETVYQRIKAHQRFSGKNHQPFDWYTRMIPLFQHRMKGQPRYANNLGVLYAEQQWYAFGCPYFKVFPQMASMMSDVSIDIPCTQLALPYDVFAIYLPPNK